MSEFENAVRNAALEEVASLMQEEICSCEYCKSVNNYWQIPERIRDLKTTSASEVSQPAQPTDSEKS